MILYLLSIIFFIPLCSVVVVIIQPLFIMPVKIVSYLITNKKSQK